MKKFLFVAVAALTLGLASCSESAKNDEATAVIENLKAQMEAGDAEGMQSALSDAQAKIAELVAKDPEAAKTYVVKVQEFINENKEQILTVVGDNAVAQSLVSTLVDAPAETVINAITAGQSVIDNAENLTDSIDQAINDKINETKEGLENAAKDAANEQIEAAKKEATNKVNETTQKANEEVNKAAEKANKELNDAASKALKSVGL